MDHRNTSVLFLKSSGLTPVRIRPGQKDPFGDWDPRHLTPAINAATMAAIEADEKLNLGALFHGRYVDIDVDTDVKALYYALDAFLPSTKYVWGRKSKPRSHRAYMLHMDFDRGLYGPVLRLLKKAKIGDRSYSVEIRGGKPENGLLTVLPGSWREDAQEMVEWEHEIDPTVSGAVVHADKLIKAVRLAMATAILSEFWVEGSRNDMSLALAGLLWRIRKTSMSVGGVDPENEEDAQIFVLNDKDAERILTTVMDIGGDDAADKRSRIINFNNTWRKLDKDESTKATGGKVLANLMGPEGEQVVRLLYRLLSDSEDIEMMEALSEQFVVWYGTGVLIDTDMVDRGMDTPWMTKEQAANSLGHKKVTIAGKKIPVAPLLFSSTIIQRVAGLTFDPSTTARLVESGEGLRVNQFRGFVTEPCGQSVSNSEVERFLNYVKEVIAAGDDHMYEWVLAWIADMLQNPAKKPGTALVLVGVQGAGKTFLGERIIGPIIGKSHYTQMNSIASLTDKFNQIADNKIFVQCDEAVHSYQRDVAAKLKSIITDESMTVEPKNINSHKKPNHMHFLFTSNEENTAIFIDPSPFERRFTVQKVSPCRANDIEYWNEMHAWTALSLPKIMRWLLDHKYDRNLIVRPIETAAKRDIQKIGIDPEVSWVIARLGEGFPIATRFHEHWWTAFKDTPTASEQRRNMLRRDVWPDKVFLPSLEADFKNFIREHGRPVYSGSVITTLKRALPPMSLVPFESLTVDYNDPKHGQPIRAKVQVFSFPSREAIIEHLRAKFGPMIDTMVEEASSTSNHIEVIHQETEEF